MIGIWPIKRKENGWNDEILCENYTKADAFANKTLVSSTVMWSTNYFAKNTLQTKRGIFLHIFDRKKEPYCTDCQIEKNRIVIYWSLTSFIKPDTLLRGLPGSLACQKNNRKFVLELKYTDILSKNFMRSDKYKYSSLSCTHMLSSVYHWLINADRPVSLKTKTTFVWRELFPK